ncbi:MAG TPA: 50S ribosomal protein L18 [Candidatus Krumholzibacteriaceae bacterium]|nr:50S ribosomal protein L18 [Candidatus Krumholzibacteriaceae bacterium]
MRNENKEKRRARKKRHNRYKHKVFGTSERPRLSVYRSLNHIYAQIIDDVEGNTIASASSLKIELPPESESAGKDEKKEGKDKKKAQKKPATLKMRRSKAVGRAIADKALKKDIKKVSFDRGGFLYHGRIAAFADEARKNGLEF